MKSILREISELVSDAMRRAFGDAVVGVDPLVATSKDAKFGDYQCNAAMGLAKQMGAKPRDVAQKIVESLGNDARSMFESMDIAGPGFINFKIKNTHLSSLLQSIPVAKGEDRLGIEPTTHPQTVVVDYSSPNVAKEMHVGHLRGTVNGDTFARVLSFEGHDVIRQNHLGDWGTQFGRIILSLWHLCMAKHQNETPADFDRIARELVQADGLSAEAKIELLRRRCEIHQGNLARDPDGGEFEQFIKSFEPSFEVMLPAYRYVNAIEDAAVGKDLSVTNPATGERLELSSVSRHVAAMLQGKTQRDNAQELAAWLKAKEATLRECNAIYRRLGVLLVDEDVRGESFYEPLLPGIVEEVQTALAAPQGPTGGLSAVCRRDKGALCVYLEKPDGTPAYKGPQGDPLPMIIQKSDGASLYATTDLAAGLFRLAHPSKHPVQLNSQKLAAELGRQGGGLGAERVVYVVGAPQKLHFEMLFATIRALGWMKKPGGGEARMEHVWFGSVLGDDRKMLRTRSGDSVKLKDLLDEAVQRAEAQVRAAEADPDRRRGFDEGELQKIAETVGIGAVKYADLCQNRNTDYVFSWEKMMALQGNTAPYMLYAYARIRSIYRKGEETGLSNGMLSSAAISLEHPVERALAMRLLQIAETIDSVAETLLPSMLCDYLYDLAGRFMAFYESCPVLQGDDASLKASRLRLCDLTARALRLGLGLLGISTLERM